MHGFADTTIKKSDAKIAIKSTLGCLCVIGRDKNGREKTEKRNNDKDCKRKKRKRKRPRRSQSSEIEDNKRKVNQELEKKFEGLAENCYPRPKGT